jgi:CRP-like cAMP-binding protein
MSVTSSNTRILLQSSLRNAAWAEKCDSSTLDLFVSHGVVRHLKRGEEFVHVGDPVNHLLVVVEGTLQVRRHTADGRRFIAGYLAAGELGNLVPFLDQSDAPNDYVAHNDTTVCQIERAIVEKCLRADFGLTQGIMAILCRRARHNFSERADLMLLTLRQRCAKILMNFATEYGEPTPAGVSLTLRLSQAEFADMVGWSRPVVNRELKRMEQEGILQISYSQVTIRDVARLSQIALDEIP